MIKPIRLQINPVRLDGNIIQYPISRYDLEILVEQAKKLKKKLINEDFYIYDLYIAERLQNEDNFLIIDSLILEKTYQYAIFNGKKYNGHKLNGAEVHFFIKDLNHLTCIRFAYAVNKLIERNWKRYPVLTKEFIKRKGPNLEDYFSERLAMYLKPGLN